MTVSEMRAELVGDEVRALRRLMVLRLLVVLLVVVLMVTFRGQMVLIDSRAPMLFYLLLPLLLPLQWMVQELLPWPVSLRVGVSFIVDIVLIIILTTATGGLMSPFSLLFALVLIAAAPFCRRVMILSLTVLCAAGYLLAAYATAWWLHLEMAPLSPLHILLHVSTLFLVGGVMAAIVDRHSRLQVARRRAEHGRDRAEQRYDEVVRKLVAQEKLAALGRMAAMVAHEVRNPLQTIAQAVGLLKDAPPREVRAQLQEAVQQEVARLDRLVNSMLRFAAPLKSEPRPCNPQELLQASLAQVGVEAEGVKVTIDCPVTRCLFDGDHFRLVADNLLRNALLHSQPGDEVSVTMQMIGDRSWRLRVKDCGGGIDAAIMPQLFEPFVTGRSSGTGLGLAMVRQVCDSDGWQVRVRNCDGGAEFTVIGRCDGG